MATPPTGAVAILGRNGAGKTTLLKTLAGEISPMSGSIHFEGQPAQEMPPERRARRGIGYVPQEHAIFAKMTVRENLELGAYTLHGPAVSVAVERALAQFPLLASKLSVLAGNLSGGEQQIPFS